jgi:hypothetical protein
MNAMNHSHPINPPSLAIIKKWIINNGLTVSIAEASAIASLASRLGADQELEACCEWLDEYLLAPKGAQLRAARRPKKPSLREQALLAIDTAVADGRLSSEVSDLVRCAFDKLETMPRD